MLSPKLVTLFGFLGVVSAAVRECPELKPVPIDEKFLFDQQPKGGFYAAAASGEDGLPKYTPKITTPGTGANKVCFKAEYTIKGFKKNSPPVTCVYDNPSQISCDPNTATAASTAALAAGQHVPKVIVSTIVDTDNKTFLAVGLCVEGAVFQWSILATEASNKHVHASTLKALHITEADINEAAAKKMKPGRAALTKGECPKFPKVVDAKEAKEKVAKMQGQLTSFGNGLLGG